MFNDGIMYILYLSTEMNEKVDLLLNPPKDRIMLLISLMLEDLHITVSLTMTQCPSIHASLLMMMFLPS